MYPMGAVTVMHVMLFVLHVSMVRECEEAEEVSLVQGISVWGIHVVPVLCLLHLTF